MSHFSNVFLIVIDSLRFDHVDCYGYHRETSTALIPSGLSIPSQVGSRDTLVILNKNKIITGGNRWKNFSIQKG